MTGSLVSSPGGPSAPIVDIFNKLLVVNYGDQDRLNELDEYYRGEAKAPLMPNSANVELRRLASKANTNLMGLIVGAPIQGMGVDGFRDFSSGSTNETASSDWEHWQRSRMDARQTAIYESALVFGHAFVLTEQGQSGTISRGLSTKRTSVLFEDPANDLNPKYALLRLTEPDGDTPGTAYLWDERFKYSISYNGDDIRVTSVVRHGALTVPITRFAFRVDLEGRTTGVVGPRITLQDRVNQAVFDLLVVQSGGAFRVKWASGMEPPIKRDGDGNPVVGPDGKPIIDDIKLNSSSFFFAKDPSVSFGSLPETPLGGYIECVELAIKHMLSIAQTPPMLGHMSNISAEFLEATERSLGRLRKEAEVAFGEAWERVARVEAEILGDSVRASDFKSEVLWRDVESRNMAAVADALGKFATQLQVPAQALWDMVPNVTQSTKDRWRELALESDSAGRLADALLQTTSQDNLE